MDKYEYYRDRANNLLNTDFHVGKSPGHESAESLATKGVGMAILALAEAIRIGAPANR